jgi:hypothetical protein
MPGRDARSFARWSLSPALVRKEEARADTFIPPMPGVREGEVTESSVATSRSIAIGLATWATMPQARQRLPADGPAWRRRTPYSAAIGPSQHGPICGDNPARTDGRVQMCQGLTPRRAAMSADMAQRSGSPARAAAAGNASSSSSAR